MPLILEKHKCYDVNSFPTLKPFEEFMDENRQRLDMIEMLSCHQYVKYEKNPILSALYECYDLDPSNTLEEDPERIFETIDDLLQYTLSHYGEMFQGFDPDQFTAKGELFYILGMDEFKRHENILLKAMSKSLKRRIILYPVTKSEEECFGNDEHPPYHILACRSGINSIYIPMSKDEN